MNVEQELAGKSGNKKRKSAPSAATGSTRAPSSRQKRTSDPTPAPATSLGALGSTSASKDIMMERRRDVDYLHITSAMKAIQEHDDFKKVRTLAGVEVLLLASEMLL